jgi:cation transport ATPase
MLSLAGSLEQHASHPISASIIANAIAAGAPIDLPIEAVQALPGASPATAKTFLLIHGGSFWVRVQDFGLMGVLSDAASPRGDDGGGLLPRQCARAWDSED